MIYKAKIMHKFLFGTTLELFYYFLFTLVIRILNNLKIQLINI